MIEPNAIISRDGVLILGGTGEARALAQALFAQGIRVVTSLAGRTTEPMLPAGEVRIGGFGGVTGLSRYLDDQAIGAVIDATHPFAATISANAVAASQSSGVPLLRIERPLWTGPHAHRWVGARDSLEAAELLPKGANVLLTIGRQGIGAFFARTDCRIVARMIEVTDDIPHNWTLLRDRGPFAFEAERELMSRNAITHLVTKNSGGHQTAQKLEAATALGVTIIMIARPVLPRAQTVSDIAGAIDWLECVRTFRA
jgi:precorrin-6A/cobalt-precorrin-6A reductase